MITVSSIKCIRILGLCKLQGHHVFKAECVVCIAYTWYLVFTTFVLKHALLKGLCETIIYISTYYYKVAIITGSLLILNI